MAQIRKGNVVRQNDQLPLEETTLVKVVRIVEPSIEGKIIYPLGQVGQARVFWLQTFLSVVPEKDYKPLIGK